MDLTVIRSNRQRESLITFLKERRLPFKLALDDIYPPRSIDLNAYYWGVVLKYISDESGHDVIECHDGYKRKFNCKIDFKINGDTGIYEPVFEVGSTTELNNKEFCDYIFQVRADGEMEHHIVIPLPNEAFVPELVFKNEL